MKDIIQLDENNRCVSANCIYTEDDKTIEYEFDNEEERMNFFSNIQDYVYQDGEFVLDELPIPEPQPSEIEILKQKQELTDQALQDLILITLGGE